MTSQPCADILARAVSVFADSTHTTPIETVPLADVLQRIQDGTYRPTVTPLRHLLATGNQTRYRREKEKSLAFTPCCAMQTRARDRPWSQKLLSTTGLVHFDLDHLDDPEAVKGQLARDAHIAFAFVSPSGQGLKIGVATSGIAGPEDYKHAWLVVLDALKRTYPDVHFNEDPHVRFLHALCYVSDDPQLYVNGQAVPYVVPPPVPSPPPPPRRMGTPPDYARVAEALACIPNHDADYETWLTLGMALHSTGEAWARDFWDSWSRQSEKCDARKQATSWGSFTRDGQHHDCQPVSPGQAAWLRPATTGDTACRGTQRAWRVSISSSTAARASWPWPGSHCLRPAPPALDAVDAARQAADSLLHAARHPPRGGQGRCGAGCAPRAGLSGHDPLDAPEAPGQNGGSCPQSV